MTTQGAAEDCELCHVKSGIYLFTNVCCRARFISGQPTLEKRRMWLGLLDKRYGKLDDVKDRVIEIRNKRSELPNAPRIKKI